ncbi:MAG: MotA/TolQ/ExbB proton channel family protein [Candidatus Dadabacteria bacterium]|nr:MotA/TolQ/ExbB proton channel family protein [Candidatus Dadabacteria bacterium]NIT13230.1 MotA/TolQ/ExbB proton channel family protein [Candidatus Dadabacteria bacterium]
MTELNSEVIEIIKKAGIFVYPIFLCSIVGLSIFLQKMWTLRTKKILPDLFLNRLYSYLSKNKYSEALNLASLNNSSIARIAFAGLQKSGAAKEEIREAMEEAGKREAIELGRYTEGLATISNVSTLLGLLGTIAGMIKIFRVISEKTIVDPPSLAGGISEALYTTAFGLLVAIPAFIAYKYVIGRSDEFINDLEEEGRRIIDEMTNTPPVQSEE